MTSNTYNKALMPIVALQLLICIVLYFVNETLPSEANERIVAEHWNFVLLLTARVSCVVSFVALTALVVIGVKRR